MEFFNGSDVTSLMPAIKSLYVTPFKRCPILIIACCIIFTVFPTFNSMKGIHSVHL